MFYKFTKPNTHLLKSPQASKNYLSAHITKANKYIIVLVNTCFYQSYTVIGLYSFQFLNSKILKRWLAKLIVFF